MNALIVEDDKETSDLLAYLLQDMGFQCQTVSGGRQAINLLASQTVDLALVDIYIPEMDGLEFVKAVRAESRHDAMKLMMVTSAANSAIVAKALQIGANEYLMKPFTKEMIRNKLRILGLLKK